MDTTNEIKARYEKRKKLNLYSIINSFNDEVTKISEDEYQIGQLPFTKLLDN